jgi:hypothetical protein
MSLIAAGVRFWPHGGRSTGAFIAKSSSGPEYHKAVRLALPPFPGSKT